jgi:hypothetical protein
MVPWKSQWNLNQVSWMIISALLLIDNMILCKLISIFGTQLPHFQKQILLN